MQCRSHAAQLGRLYNDFRRENTQVLLVLGAPVEKTMRYAQNLHLPFPVLADPSRNLYHQYGLDKALNIVQRTASIVIDCHGIIAYMKNAHNPFTWLQESVEVLNFVKSLVVTC